MQTATRIGSARATGNKANAGSAGEFAVSLGHIRRTALITANRKRNFGLVIQCVERGEKTFSGDAKNAID
jgi:hypothetical protein